MLFVFLEAWFPTYVFPPKGTASNTLDNRSARKTSSLAKSLFVASLSVVKRRRGEKKKAKRIVKMNADVTATVWLKGQVGYLDIATRALSFQIWPKKFNGRLTRVSGQNDLLSLILVKEMEHKKVCK